ncbi:MAG: hypothetical protein ACREBU_00900 [Nitrososphaera sp.]
MPKRRESTIQGLLELAWLEYKQYVQAGIKDGRVVYGLTEEGKKFASKLLSIEE